MEGRKFRAARALLTAAAIVIASLAQSISVAVGLACLVLVVELGHELWEIRQEKTRRAKFEEELAETPWMLVPGPGA